MVTKNNVDVICYSLGNNRLSVFYCQNFDLAKFDFRNLVEKETIWKQE